MVAMDDHTATVDNPAVRDFALFGHFRPRYVRARNLVGLRLRDDARRRCGAPDDVSPAQRIDTCRQYFFNVSIIAPSFI